MFNDDLSLVSHVRQFDVLMLSGSHAVNSVTFTIPGTPSSSSAKTSGSIGEVGRIAASTGRPSQ
jgi:hypothetical protein